RIGLPAISVACGPWSHGGMAAKLQDRGGLSAALPKLRPAAASALLEKVLADGPTTVGAADIRWPAFLERLGGGQSGAFFEHFRNESPNVGAAARSSQASRLLQRLPTTAHVERVAMVLEFVTATAARVLDFDPSARFNEELPLRQQGLDSLMAVELRN